MQIEQARLTIGEGSIDPDKRIAEGSLDETAVRAALAELTTGLYYETAHSVIPAACVDGRSPADEAVNLMANAAGGTFSMVVADALTARLLLQPDMNAAQHAEAVFNHYIKLGIEGVVVGGHDDSMAHSPQCGCGAEDKLDAPDASQPSILRYIVQRSDDIRAVIASLGTQVPQMTHEQIATNAQELIARQYATSGSAVRDVYQRVAGDDAVTHLQGTHKEVAVVMNLVAGTTLNRARLLAAHGTEIQVFNVDVPALRKAAELFGQTTSQVDDLFMGALYYNVATAAVLAAPSLRVCVRK